ncbi:MAG: GGDEF domain-containing protein [Lachnospiraceae bacterium]|nr:GGDEF domain-containing protein [Lachnospiraceae bacterium]
MGQRKTIGLFVANVEDVFCNSICRGAYMAAEEKNINLIIFPGKYLRRYEEDDIKMLYEYQYNTLFSYCYPESIDGLVSCVGSICSQAHFEVKDKFLKNTNGVPILSVASKESGYSSIQYDNITGIKEGIDYLITVQGLRKIGLIAGTITNEDAEERLEAYKESLIEHGIAVDDQLIVHGDFTKECTEKVELLLNRNPDIEAIVCANDDTAKGVYETLSKRGIRVGKDIAVLGFDDVPDSVKMNPPLATVRADASDLGYEAVCTILEMLESKKQIHKILKTKFIKRESVGFKSFDMHELIGKFEDEVENSIDVKAICDNVTEFVFRDINHDYQAECQRKVLWTFFQKLLSRYFDNIIKRNSTDDLYTYFDNMVERGVMLYVDSRKIFQVFYTIYQIFCERNKILTQRLELHTLQEKFEQKVVEWMSIELVISEKQHFEMYHITNRITRDILMFSDETEQSYANALEKVDTLDIKNSYLYVWEKPVEHNRDMTWIPPENILLKAYQKGNQVFSIPRTDQKISTHQMCDNPFFEREDRFTYLVLDVYDQNLQYGLYICDIKYDYLHYVEYLTYQLSLAVRTLNHFQLQRSTQKKLEESLERLQAHNIELGTISKMDELTGIYNRRGFYQYAEELLNRSDNEGKIFLVCYADMDKLKTINDTYGHDEGDFAIRCCADILKEACVGNAIVGRIGGDEFAVILRFDSADKIKQLRKRIDGITKLVNEKHQKPFEVQLSIGMREFEYRKGIELKAMIDEADELLYIEKKNR